MLGTLQMSTGLRRRFSAQIATIVKLIVARRERQLFKKRKRAATRITAASLAAQQAAAITLRRLTAFGKLKPVRSAHLSKTDSH